MKESQNMLGYPTPLVQCIDYKDLDRHFPFKLLLVFVQRWDTEPQVLVPHS